MLLKALYEKRIMYFTRHDSFGGKQKMKGVLIVRPDELISREALASESKIRPYEWDSIRVRYRIYFPDDPYWDQEGWGELFRSGHVQHNRNLKHGAYLHLVGKNRTRDIFFDLKLCFGMGHVAQQLEEEKAFAAGGKDAKGKKGSAGKKSSAEKKGKKKRSFNDDEIQIGGTYSFEGGATESTTSTITGSTSDDSSDGNSEKEPPIYYPPW